MWGRSREGLWDRGSVGQKEYGAEGDWGEVPEGAKKK